MGLDKKITVKFFLNTALKPFQWEGENLYPIYIRVIYNRKSNNYRYEPDLFSTENDFENTIKGLDPELEKVEKILNYELNKHKSKFKLSGISHKINKYQTPFLITILNFLNYAFDIGLIDQLSPKEHYQIKNRSLYYKFIRLDKLGAVTNIIITYAFLFATITQFDDKLTIYDWMFNNKKLAFKRFLLENSELSFFGLKFKLDEDNLRVLLFAMMDEIVEKLINSSVALKKNIIIMEARDTTEGSIKNFSLSRDSYKTIAEKIKEDLNRVMFPDEK